jgi:(E)-2-((N-methylformamido)methylene)succinate hydrolase
MTTITTGSFLGRIPYARRGSGSTPLLILSGGQAFIRRIDPSRLTRDARRVARMLPAQTSFVLLGYDPHPRADLSFDMIADDVAAVIKEYWSGRASIVGISYGGLVAARVAARWPEQIAHLVLVASAHRFSNEGVRRIRRLILFAKSGDFRSFVDDFVAVCRRPWLNGAIRLRVWLTRGKLDRTMAQPETILRYLCAMLEARPPEISDITARTLVIGGSEDQFFGGDAMPETAAGIPGAKIKLLRGETHMMPIERPGEVAAAIGQFLAK